MGFKLTPSNPLGTTEHVKGVGNRWESLGDKSVVASTESWRFLGPNF